MGMTIFDTCVHITGKFEGTGYGSVTGNFDKQGISAGLLQWNIGSGTLQHYILNYHNVDNHEFPRSIRPLQDLKPAEAVVWVKDVMLDEVGNLKPEWKKSWEAFMTHPYVINTQKYAIGKYFQRAKEIAGKAGFTQDNARAMAWAFDIAVQNWSFEVDRVEEASLDHARNIMSKYSSENYALWSDVRLTPEQRRMIVMTHYRCLKSKPEWRNDVFARKATIAMGVGIVHKTKHDFNKLFTGS